MVKGYFTSEARKLRCNTITLDDWENFVRHPNSKRLLELTRDMPPTDPPGLAGSSGSYPNQLTLVSQFNY